RRRRPSVMPLEISVASGGGQCPPYGGRINMAFPPTHGRMPNERRSKDGEDQTHRSGGRIDLNHASKEDIMSAAGLDRKTAAQILRFRDERGGFETWRDFDEIPIAEEDREELRPHVAI